MGLLDFLKETIGIDPGSQHLRIIKDGSLIFNEQSQVSFNKQDSVLTGFGDSIKTAPDDVTLNPVDYIIADFHGFEILLRGAIKKGSDSKSLFPKSYAMYFCVPSSLTENEKRTYRDAAEHVGAIELYMIQQSVCSAIAMNLLFEQKHFILIDFGFSKIEIIVFANSMPVSVGIIKMGTSKIFRMTKNFLRRKHKIEIDDKDIESFFKTLAKHQTENEINIQHTLVNVNDIQELLNNFFNLVNDQLMETIERVSNHSDIGKVISNGIFLTGGGATFDFMTAQIKLGTKMTLSKNPLLDNINGLKIIMADKAKFERYIVV